MANFIKNNFLNQIENLLGSYKKFPNSLSLFEFSESNCRILIRYSKIHNKKQGFYGIRKEDLKYLDGHISFICFLWENQKEPLFVLYKDFDEILSSLEPASDGQIKAQIYIGEDSTELYLANAGRYNVEGYYGWEILKSTINENNLIKIPNLNHSQIQTIVGSIGIHKGFDIWIPPIDRSKLDWNLSKVYECKEHLPERYSKVIDIIKEIDIIWLKKGSSDIAALFEVEHSTPIYSGLLRFNDLFLIESKLNPRFSIISNELRKSLFLRQISRPTFKLSGLSEVCSFLEYKDVYNWYSRTSKGT